MSQSQVSAPEIDRKRSGNSERQLHSATFGKTAPTRSSKLAPEEHFTFSIEAGSQAQKRFALFVVLGMLAVFLVLVGPFSNLQTGRAGAFVPAYTMAMVVVDAITAVFLFAEFSIVRTRALLVISSGYLFNALIVIPWILTFPDVFVPGSLVGGLQSTPYIHFFWHAGFPISVIIYALLKDRSPEKRYWYGSVIGAVLFSIVLTIIAVLVAASIFIFADPILPRLQRDPLRLNWQWLYLAVPITLLSAIALIALWTRRRSTLDFWLMVVMCAYGIEMCLSFFPVPARYTLNWYAGKVFSLLSSSIVLLALLYEITALYTRLQDALRAAKQADHAKSSFLSAASHDLRQPLQTLNLLQRALKPRIRDEESQTMLAGISRSVGTMSSILSSLLDVNRLEAGALIPSISTFPLNDIFDSIAADFSEPAKEKGLELRIVRSGISIRSDQRMIEEMLRNLLSNAIRYTDRGKIVVGCRRADDKVLIEVWDSGVGIMGDQINRIFEEYYQVNESADLGGIGLGLAIVQRLAKLLDHRIDVRSVPGKGSGFSIEVPLADKSTIAQDHSKALPETADAPFMANILIIEDESDVRAALDSLLRSLGLSVLSAVSGHEALVLVAKSGMRPDLVISDYNLPGTMNGAESIEALRAALSWKIPGIVLTGDTRSQVIESIATYDIAVVAKPCDANELLRLIRLRSRSSVRAPGSRNIHLGNNPDL